MGCPIRRIKPRTDEFVDLISVENSCEARIARAQPCLHSAIGGAGEYYRPSMEVEDIGRKTWHKILYQILNLCALDNSDAGRRREWVGPLASAGMSAARDFSMVHLGPNSKPQLGTSKRIVIVSVNVYRVVPTTISVSAE